MGFPYACDLLDCCVIIWRLYGMDWDGGDGVSTWGCFLLDGNWLTGRWCLSSTFATWVDDTPGVGDAKSAPRTLSSDRIDSPGAPSLRVSPLAPDDGCREELCPSNCSSRWHFPTPIQIRRFRIPPLVLFSSLELSPSPVLIPEARPHTML